jgi:hypothetical protein
VLPKGFVRIRHFGFLANHFRASRLSLSRHCWPRVAQPRSEVEPTTCASRMLVSGTAHAVAHR